jgi:hypothetical protein
MHTIATPDPTIDKIPPASGAAQAGANTASSPSRGDPLHRKIGGALGALALMVGTLAVVASVAAPTASAMKQECYNHVLAGRYAEAHGMYQLADLEYAAANACDDGY